MDVHATEKEQIESLKKWWKDNGSSIVIGLLLGLSVLLGGKAWLGYKETQKMNASNIYAQLLGAESRGEINLVRDHANQLVGNYSSSVYASYAALMLAKMAVTDGELDAARVQLQWAVDHAGSAELKNLGRMRLARVLTAQEKFTEARQVLQVVTEPGVYSYLFSELEGDIALHEGDTAKAAQAYKRALDNLPEQSPNAQMLTSKYESVELTGDSAQ